jgi:orotate phosphoribosyltransferase
MDIQVENILIRDDANSGEPIWDEWLLYEDIKKFTRFYNDFVNKFRDTLNDFDYICSLGKSGFPLASKLAIDLRKPLIVSSMAEFIYENKTYLLGVGTDDDLTNKKIACIDSHCRTGGSIKQFQNLINLKKINCAVNFVLFDCSESERGKDLKIQSLFKWKDLSKSIQGKISPERLNDTHFWMKDDQYWLTSLSPEMIELNTFPDKCNSSFEELFLEQKTKNLFCTDGFIKPLDLYKHIDIFESFIQKIIIRIINQNISVDTFVAGSVAAIPIAFNLACTLKKNYPEKDIKFVFLMNESYQYYQAKLKGREGIMLCDDTIFSGGLLYAIYKVLLDNGSHGNLKGIITFFNSLAFPKEGKRYINTILSENPQLLLLSGISV